MGQYFRFRSQADREAFSEAIVQVVALTNAAGGKSFGYNLDTAPTELTMVWVWDSTASFQTTEKLFAQTEVITAMVGTFTCEAYFCGDISTETKGLVAKWNEAPGFDIRVCENELAYADKTCVGMSHDAMGAFGVFEHASEAARDAYFAEAKKTAAVWMSRSHVVSHAKVSGSSTKSVHIWMFKSKEDTLSWMAEDIPSKIMEPGLAMIPSMVKFGGVCFGNTTDAEINVALKPWSTWKVAPLVSGSLGGNFLSFIQKAVFKDTAARNAALAALKASTIGGDHGGAFFACPLGESQAWICHYANDQAGNKAIQAGFSADPALMASFLNNNITHQPCFLSGNVQNEWMTDLAGWSEVLPLYNEGSPLVCHREGGSFGPDCFHVIQELEFNDAAGYETYIDMQMDPAVMNEPIKFSGSMWKTSSTTAQAMYCFSSSDDWLAANINYAPYAEAFGKAMKKVTGYLSGPISAEAQAGIDGWASLDWVNMSNIERVGKMGQ